MSYLEDRLGLPEVLATKENVKCFLILEGFTVSEKNPNELVFVTSSYTKRLTLKANIETEMLHYLVETLKIEGTITYADDVNYSTEILSAFKREYRQFVEKALSNAKDI